MITRSIYPSKPQPALTLLSTVAADEEVPVGQYNSIYTGAEIDGILAEAEQIPDKEDKPIVENITGAVVSLDVKAGHEYICGTLTSLTLKTVENSTKESSITFACGDTETELVLPDNLSVDGYKIPEVGRTYEISIKNNSAIIIRAE